MKAHSAITKPAFVLVTLAALLFSCLAIAMDHHALDDQPLTGCPICAAAQVLSNADHAVPAFQLKAPCREFAALPPPAGFYPIRQIFLPHIQNRAPPPNTNDGIR